MTGREAGGDAELKKELDATLHARRELGEEYESALVDSFLAKVEQRLDGAVDRRVRRQLAEQQMVVARGSRSPQGATDSWGALRFRDRVTGPGGPSVRDRRRPGASARPVGRLVGIVGVNVVQAARVTPNFFGRRRAKSDSDWED